MSFVASRFHSTELATATQRSQSRASSATVPNACCSAGMPSTANWSATERPIAAHSQWFENNPANAPRSSDRALSVLKSWNSMSVVNAMDCP